MAVTSDPLGRSARAVGERPLPAQRIPGSPHEIWDVVDETGRRDSLPIDQWSNSSEDAPMRVSSMQCTRRECDGCGAPAPGPDPAGWFDRELDPGYYTGPRRLLFCP